MVLDKQSIQIYDSILELLIQLKLGRNNIVNTKLEELHLFFLNVCLLILSKLWVNLWLVLNIVTS